MSADVPDPASGIGPDGTWSPAFPGQRPPLAPGHEVTVQHGGYSPRKVDPLAQSLVEQTVADPSSAYLAAPVFRPALYAWARAEAQVQLLVEYLAKAAEVTGDGVGDLELDRVRSAYLLLHRAESRAETGRRRLGLDPLSRAKLGKDVTAAQANAAELLTAMRERAEAGEVS